MRFSHSLVLVASICTPAIAEDDPISAALKREISLALGSDLIEEKSYGPR